MIYVSSAAGKCLYINRERIELSIVAECAKICRYMFRFVFKVCLWQSV